jgi:hypothetical protein
MMTLPQLRKKYCPVSPMEALDDLAMIVNHPKKEGFSPPLLTVVMISGNTFRAYLLSGTPEGKAEKSYLFSLETVNQGDGANDLIYVQGHRIESVTFWNVEDYAGILPRFKDKLPAP